MADKLAKEISEIVRHERMKQYIREQLFGGMPRPYSAKVLREWTKKRKAKLEAQGEVINIDLDQRKLSGDAK